MGGRIRYRHRGLWHMLLAPTIWAVDFVLVYALTAIICAKAGDAAMARFGIVAVSALAFTAICVVGWRAWRQWDYLDDFDYVHDSSTDEDRSEFLGHTGVLLAIVSAIGVIYVSLPAMFIGTCQ